MQKQLLQDDRIHKLNTVISRDLHLMIHPGSAGAKAGVIAATALFHLVVDERGELSEPAAAAATAAGAPAALVQQLRWCTDGDAVHRVALAVATLARSGSAAHAVHAAGGTAVLAQLLCSCSDPSALTEVACAIGNLAAKSDECCADLAAPPESEAPEVLSRLVQLLGGAAGGTAQTEAARTLANVLAAFPRQQPAAAAIAARLRRHGAVPAAAGALRAAAIFQHPQPEDTARLAAYLAHAGHGAELLDAGVAPHLLQLAASAETRREGCCCGRPAGAGRTLPSSQPFRFGGQRTRTRGCSSRVHQPHR